MLAVMSAVPGRRWVPGRIKEANMGRGNRTTGRAVLLAATGTAAAAAVIGLSLPAGASPAAPRSAATLTGTEHFQLVGTSATSNRLNILAWGPFATVGTDFESTSNSATGTDLAKVTGGTFKIIHTFKSEKQTMNPRTCFLSVVGKGTYRLSGGTGAYKGISGSGSFTLTVYAIAARTKKGACNENANPVGFQQVITAAGPVKLP
jgi:hypothetical protein